MPKKEFVSVGERIRYIGTSKYRDETWPKDAWLEKGITGTVTEFHEESPEVIAGGERFEAIPPYAVVTWDFGGRTAIDPETENIDWQREHSSPVKPLRGNPKRYIIKEEPEPLYESGKKYVAYYEDGTPRYLAAETEQALKTRLLEAEPNAEFVTPPAVEEVKSEGGNPMDPQSKKHLADKKAMEEAGRSYRPPLLALGGLGEKAGGLLPMSPEEGPPLPKALNIRWPWSK